MRDQLARVLAGVPALAGTAERIPLADHAVDAVLVAQAWHWVDPARAVPEAVRVLAPGGRLGLLWNIRDERVDWVAQLTRIIHTPDYVDNGSDAPVVGPPFGPVERFDVEWSRPTTPAGIIDLVASRSYIITMPPDQRAAVLARVQRLLAPPQQRRARRACLAATAWLLLPAAIACLPVIIAACDVTAHP